MTFPLATYSAEHGLEWHYDKSAIRFADLDRCRHLLGALPNFNSGDSDYVGVAAVGERVFAIRCAKAKTWDFKGRDALYMTVTWMSRTDALNVDFQALLKSQGMCAQTHEYKFSFEAECHWNREDKNKPDWLTHIQSGDDVFVRQDLDGSNPAIRIVEKQGEYNIMTEAEKVLFGKGEEPPQQSTRESATHASQANSAAADAEKSVVAPSYGSRIIAAIVFLIGLLLGTYLARQTHHEIFGFIVMAAALGIARTLWHSGGKHA